VSCYKVWFVIVGILALLLFSYGLCRGHIYYKAYWVVGILSNSY